MDTRIGMHVDMVTNGEGGLSTYLAGAGWSIAHSITIPARAGLWCTYDDFELSQQSRRYLGRRAPQGLYGHQRTALEELLKGNNVCSATGTASGKSLTFHVAACECLAQSSDARIMAIYPLRALARQQAERWSEALGFAGIDAQVGRVDGSVHSSKRDHIIRECEVLILTPDILHAWLLNGLSNRYIVSFLARLKVVVVDEVHVYTGVFGSNSAFLFRRLLHALEHLGAAPAWVGASATIADPSGHMMRLTGKEFHVIPEEQDRSPKGNLLVTLAKPPATTDLLSSVSDLMNHVRTETDHRFLAFVDSRKLVEHLTSITSWRCSESHLPAEGC